MTNDEKVRAYDMALEAARKELGVDRKEWEVVQRVLHNIFPTLAESEDERIRKGLLDIFSQSQSGHWAGMEIKDIVAWLEKQKEQKDFRKLYEDIAKSEWFKKAYHGKSLGIEDEQKEQKPAEWSDTNELVFKDICKHLKEEGYGGWVVLLEALKNGEFSNPTIDNNTVNVTMIADPKTGERVPFVSYKDQEWSEEDEKMLDFYADEVTDWCGKYKSELRDVIRATAYHFYTFRPSWKPSEEQMKALKNSAYGTYQNGDGPALRELYDNLKKLNDGHDK